MDHQQIWWVGAGGEPLVSAPLKPRHYGAIGVSLLLLLLLLEQVQFWC